MTDQKSAGYRAAIIGCGSIANSHASGYNRVEATTLVACADTVEAKAAEFCRTKRYSELLRRLSTDA